MTKKIDLQSAFLELSSTVLGSEPVEATMRRVAELAAGAVEGADQVSVTLIRKAKPVTVAFTGDLAVALDERQYDEGFGPCVDAARTSRTIAIADTSSDEGYRDFAEACRRRGVQRTLSVGLPADQQVMGAINLYGLGRMPFDGEAIQAAETFAQFASIALANAAVYSSAVELADQMHTAIRSRSAIEQAKGIIMAQRKCSADDAFEFLTSRSQASNTKLREVAREIVDSVDPSRN